MDVKKIYLIEDEPDLVEVVSDFLESDGYEVTSSLSAEEFYDKWDAEHKGLFLIDWNLPGKPGLDIVKKVRAVDKFIPIFMVSAFTSENDIVQGLQAGADDYITKPFRISELSLRVRNALAKYNLNTKVDEDLKLMPEVSAFQYQGKTVNLTQREFTIFQFLFENLNQPVTRDDLLNCFDKSDKMTVRNIDVHIFSLRKKIKQHDFLIETVWGLGYKLTMI